MTILNLTQHIATSDQLQAGVIEPSNKAAIQAALTFTGMPTCKEIEDRAGLLAALAVKELYWNAVANSNMSIHEDEDAIIATIRGSRIMVAGAPYLMSALEAALKDSLGFQPVYAFSERVSVEIQNADGSVTKTNQFKHIGFVEV